MRRSVSALRRWIFALRRWIFGFGRWIFALGRWTFALPISSPPTRLSRSTRTSARPPASAKCSCKATPEKSNSFLPYPTPGRMARRWACAPGAAVPLTSSGGQARSFRRLFTTSKATLALLKSTAQPSPFAPPKAKLPSFFDPIQYVIQKNLPSFPLLEKWGCVVVNRTPAWLWSFAC